MTDLLNIGVSGLLAYQRSLATVSHNITNVNTDGYSRQTVNTATRPPQFTGAGFEGAGVQVTSIQRSYDKFLTEQLSESLTAFRQQEKLALLSSELDNFLADPEVGLSPVLQNFFKSVQDMSTDPSSAPARQVMISEANTLATVFNDSYSRLDKINGSLNTDIGVIVDQVNNLSGSIANINKQIVSTRGSDNSFPANDLLDQRQVLIDKLSELVAVKTQEQDDGSVNVFIGKGQSLVVGTKAINLSVTSNEFDATRIEVGVRSGSTVSNISSQLSGGELGAIFDFRDGLLKDSFNSIGQVALALSEDFNAQHQLGLDLNGQLGGNFFNDITTSLSAGSSFNNVATNTVYQTTVTDSNLLRASDYRMSYDGTDYTLTRLEDNAVVAGPSSLVALSAAVSASEGFTISLSSGATVNASDSFLFTPTKSAARDIAVAISNVNDVAAASPLKFSRNATNGGSALFGNDVLTTVNAGATLPAVPLTFTFDSTLNVFNITNNAPVNTIAYNPATDSGNTLQLSVAGLGTYSFTVTGTPSNGDSFVLDSNVGGVGDNKNALALIGLQTQKRVGNGSANYQDSFAQLVTKVGVKTSQAEFGRDASEVLYHRSVESQQTVSGVNLDEEAANLLKFQQAYQASARIITTADELFQTLLSAVSR